jgi:hypothetical protein
MQIVYETLPSFESLHFIAIAATAVSVFTTGHFRFRARKPEIQALVCEFL